MERLEKRLAELEQEEKDLQAKVMKGNLPADQVQAGYEKMGTVAKQIAQVMGNGRQPRRRWRSWLKRPEVHLNSTERDLVLYLRYICAPIAGWSRW
ncbi:MAG: hypothetical protein IPF78_13805 [Flavobacteriales bacterium]|nr:hypothetical protein [Flavobacteriales bacterium]